MSSGGSVFVRMCCCVDCRVVCSGGCVSWLVGHSAGLLCLLW